MNLNQFSSKADLLSKFEIEKVLLLAYFFLRTENLKEFTVKNVIDWFGKLSFSLPNSTRLRNNLKKSRKFVRGNKRDTFRLHAKVVQEFDKQYPNLKKIIEDKTKGILKLNLTLGVYVDTNRIEELKNLKSNQFDLSRLVKLCEELNKCCREECHHSIIMLLRAIIDHVPPIFNRCKNFKEVANNYSGSNSFKKSMQNLENSSRNIADQFLHCQIRSKEVLPTVKQTDFSNDLDLLLAEIVRILI
jgi:hypothetical protein